ncbi:RNase H family protein [Serratia sp. Se-RSBMAAmG]|uniref:ribonuclease HI n=1 Tax=Serratia sp. Se-RSBMAAmG TaxID=3043305 RepID=UPI0024AF1373|nr:RNase H family protein [Serratia sp. Se-RSBMAAmG]MDI6977674.1 hypothetical protein [Serratia sp. Se-RSBMAAmG]
MNDITTTNVDSSDEDVEISYSLGMTCYGKANSEEYFMGYNLYLIKKEISYLNGWIPRCEFVKVHEFSDVLENEAGYSDVHAYLRAMMLGVKHIKASDYGNMTRIVYFNSASFGVGDLNPLKKVCRFKGHIGHHLDLFSVFTIEEMEDFAETVEGFHVEFEHERGNFNSRAYASELKALCEVESDTVEACAANAEFVAKLLSGEIAATSDYDKLTKAERKRFRKSGGRIIDLIKPRNPYVMIHTDGSIHRYGDKSGYGAVVLDESENKLFNLIGSIPFVTRRLNIQYVEMYAIHRALVAIKAKMEEGVLPANTEVRIYSDSQDCINCLQGFFSWNGRVDANLIKKLYMEIRELDMTTTYHKVKGHAGHKFNEYADSLARQGAMKGFTGEMINYYKENNQSVSL